MHRHPGNYVRISTRVPDSALMDPDLITEDGSTCTGVSRVASMDLSMGISVLGPTSMDLSTGTRVWASLDGPGQDL